MGENFPETTKNHAEIYLCNGKTCGRIIKAEEERGLPIAVRENFSDEFLSNLESLYEKRQQLEEMS